MQTYPSKLSQKPKPGWSLLVIALIMNLILPACSSPGSELTSKSSDEFGQTIEVAGVGQYTDILPQDLASMMEEKDFFLANVHIPYDGEIPNTDDFIPFDQVENSLNAFPQDKEAKIVVYCRSGSMSSTAAAELVKLGYTNVFNLDGGFNAWSTAGYDFIRSNGN